MAQEKIPDGRQEALFLVGPDQRIVERNFYDEVEAPHIPIIERAIHLHNVLSLFDQVNIRRGLVDTLSVTHPEILRRKYGKNADQVVAGAAANAELLFEGARTEFWRAFGYRAVQQGGEVPQDKLDIGTEREFTKLWSRFGLPSKVIERKQKREQIEAIIEGRRLSISQHHRAEGIRPLEKLSAKDDRSQLGTQERLKALTDDERAGFIPATHREKNMVLAFLDYQDNPAYDFGIRNQLLEIGYRHYGKHGAEYGGQLALQAMVSITHEISDMFNNALQQLSHLRELEALVQDCPNPRVTLADEIGPAHPGYAPLTRFMDLTELRDKGAVKGLNRDPLRTHRNESIVEPELRGEKHKIQEDQYTRREPRPLFKKRIADLPVRYTIGDMRQVVGRAITNEEKRAYYMYARLKELNQPDKGGMLERASRVAGFALQRLAS